MQAKKFMTAAAAALTLCAVAHADEPENNVVRVGYAKVRFNLQSGDLTGPPGTTPPGLRIDAKNLDVFALSYERRLADNWSAQIQAGIPPALSTVGAGTAASAGVVAKARIWFPTAMVRYTIPGFSTIRPYVAGGVTYTFFTEQEVAAGLTAALQGTASTLKMDSAWGAYGRVGLEYPIDQRWCLNLELSTFRLRTSATVATQTPGFGVISRHIDLKDAPRILGVTIGYRF